MTAPEPIAIVFAFLAAFAGFGAGWLHFASLRHVSRMIVEGRMAGVGLQILRFTILAALFWLFVQGGALVLIAGAAGVLAGRVFVMRRLQ